VVDQLADLGSRAEGALVGACIAEVAAGGPAGAADLLGVAESLASSGTFDPDDLRRRGLDRPSKSGSAGLLLRGLPFGLLTPFDRPRLRRDAYRCVALAGADEATAVTAVAVALLTADLPRVDQVTTLVRLRQSLLEDAPMPLLDRFRVPEAEPPDLGPDPGAVLQAAIGALDRATGVEAVAREGVRASAVAAGLAAALAGVRDGLDGIDDRGRLHDVPHAEAAISIAHRLAERAAAMPATAS